MRYTYLPFARRGAAAGVVTGDGTGRARSTVTLRVVSLVDGVESGAEDVRQSVEVLGPGDVTGLAAGQVLRTVPVEGDHDAEPNYLASVELAHPDLPWMFTPRGPDGTHLAPWIALVVVEEPEGRPVVTALPGRRNPVLVTQADQLPDLAQSWAWAHVEVLVADGLDPAAVVAAPERYPGLVRSRLVCPRHLEAGRSYTAAVVPTYDAGVQAGLTGAATDPASWQRAAWHPGAGTVTLPVYHSWRFATGPAGDFETLARKLTAVSREALSVVGFREVLVDPVRGRLQDPAQPPLAEPVVVRVATAITAAPPQPGQLSPFSPEPHASAGPVARRLKQVLDTPVRLRRLGSDRPVVGPPLYGQWAAEATSSDADPSVPDVVLAGAGAPPPWLPELALDPERRVAAGLGTRVVQQDQDELMAQAWDQLAAVVAANERARWGQLFRATATQLHTRRLEPRPAGTLLRTAAPALSRLRFAEEVTVAARLDASPLPAQVLGPAFARAARYAARASAEGRARRAPTMPLVQAVTEPLLAGRWAAVAPRTGAAVSPARMTADQIGELLERAGVADRIRVETGVELAEHIGRLGRLPQLVTDAVARTEGVTERVTQPVTERVTERVVGPVTERVVGPQEGIGPAVGPGTVGTSPLDTGGLVVRSGGFAALHSVLGSSAARDLDVRVVDTATVTGVSGSASAAASVLAGVATGPTAAAAAAVSGTHLRRGALDVELEGVLVRVPDLQLDAIRAISDAASVGVAATTSGRLATMAAAVTAQFGVRHDVVPTMLAVLPRAGLDRFVGAVGTLAPSLVVAADRRTPPPVSPLDAADARTVLLDRLEPSVQYHRMLEWLTVLDPERTRRRSPSHPVMAAPRLPQPVVDRLTRLDADWVLGGVRTLPPNSIAVLRSNPQFVEAALAGANHELARELVWRGYPTDAMGTCLPRFWPTPAAADGSLPDDIAPMATWGGRLGEHPPVGHAGTRPDATIVVVRGDLLRRYRETEVSAVFGTTRDDGEDLVFVPDPTRPVARQLFRGQLPPDVTYVGLDIDPDELTAPPGPGEWFLALTQPVEGPRFGLDDESLGTTGQGSPTDIDDLSWQRFEAAGLVGGGHLSLASQPGGTWPAELSWGPGSDAGAVAAALLQLPFQLLLPAKENLL